MPPALLSDQSYAAGNGMASLLKSVSGFLDTVIRRGAPAAQQAAPAAARGGADGPTRNPWTAATPTKDPRADGRWTSTIITR